MADEIEIEASDKDKQVESSFSLDSSAVENKDSVQTIEKIAESQDEVQVNVPKESFIDSQVDVIENTEIESKPTEEPSNEEESVPSSSAKEEEIPFYERPVIKTKKRKEIEPLTDVQKDFPWYVVNAYSGYEKRAKLNLEENIRLNGLCHKFGQIIVPEEKVVELVRGERKTSSRKFYPGYMLVQCLLDDETWHLVKDTEKITGFIGDSRNPVPLTKKEVESLMKQMEGGAQRSRPTAQFEQGDAIKVIDGPFMDFNGTVDEVKADKGKLRVLISIFGRNTPVELDFVQVEKV